MISVTPTNQDPVRLGVEGEARLQFDRQGGVAVRGEGGDLLGQNAADIAVADAGLRHGGRVDIDLEGRLTPGQKVGFETRRDDQHEGIAATVHRRIDLMESDLFRASKIGRQEHIQKARGELRAVLIDDGDSSVVQIMADAGCGTVDPEGERVDHQDKHDGIVAKAVKLLHAKPEDIAELAHPQRSWALSKATLNKVRMGKNMSSARMSPCSSAKPSALVKLPTLMFKKYIIGKEWPMA